MTSVLSQRRRSMTGYRRRCGRVFGSALGVALALSVLPAGAQPHRTDPPTSIEVRATPLEGFDHRDRSRRQFGLLEFRGGLVLTSPFKEFGGISALRVQADGEQFIAASDKGWWLRGRITYSGTRPTGIVDAEMAPILGPDGKPLA